MLSAYHLVNGHLAPAPVGEEQGLIWIDLNEPSVDEEKMVEEALGIDVPTRDEMHEIELSSRLYEEGEALFATAPILVGVAEGRPLLTPVTFILKGNQLVTVRYNWVRPFDTFVSKACRTIGPKFSGATAVLLGLIEATVERLADVLELAGAGMETLGQEIFHDNSRFENAGAQDLRDILRRLGRMGDMLTKGRESMVGVARMVAFLETAVHNDRTHKENKARLDAITHDLQALTDHVGYLTDRIGLLLDATLGLINMEQANVTKILSGVSVVFLPPTLIASIYGMNFELMPELHWAYGYHVALVVMVALAVLPYWYLKRKGWL